MCFQPKLTLFSNKCNGWKKSLDLLHAYFINYISGKRLTSLWLSPLYCVTSRLLAFWLLPNGQCNHRDVKLSFLFSGKIVEDSAFRDGRFIWPEGYTAVRKFTSVTGETFIVVVWGVDISYSFYWFFECSVIHVIFLILVILFFVVV